MAGWNIARVGSLFRWLTVWAWGFWLAVIPTVLGVVWLLDLPVTEFQVVLLAGVLQLLGIAGTVYSLYDDAKAFGASLTDPVKKWWSFRPWGVRSGRIAAFTMPFEVNASGRVSFRRQPGDFDKRVSELERHVDWLEQIHAELSTNQAKFVKEITAKVDSEKASREKELTAVREQLKDHAVGGVHVSFLGVYWVLLGTVLSLVKDAIAAH